MKPVQVRSLIPAGNTLGEGPQWHVAEQALYWIDCLGRELLRWRESTGEVTRWPLAGAPGSFVFGTDGRILIAYRNGLAFLDPETGATVPIAVDGVDFATERFNDGKCDAHGRFWVGTMDRELQRPLGSLYRIDPDLVVRRIDNSFLTLSNGIAWSPDGKVMYLCDSRPGRILRYDFDPDSGEVGNRQVFVDYSNRTGRPDGCAVDVEGGLWVADFDGSQVVRYDPAGRCDHRIEMPVARPTSVAFGGASLDALFITSMRHGVDLAEQPAAGNVFVAYPGIGGIAATSFTTCIE